MAFCWAMTSVMEVLSACRVCLDSCSRTAISPSSSSVSRSDWRYLTPRGRHPYATASVRLRIIRRNPQAIPPVSTNLSVAWSVCLSSLCHIRALCLNRLTDFDASWQVHLCGPVTRCVRWDPYPPTEGEIWGYFPAKTWNCKLQPNRQTCKRGERFRLLPNYFGPCYITRCVRSAYSCPTLGSVGECECEYWIYIAQYHEASLLR